MKLEKVFEVAEKPLWNFHLGLRHQGEDKNKDGTIKKHFLRMREVALKIIIQSSSSLQKHKTLGSFGWFSIHHSYLYGGKNENGIWTSGVMGKPLALRFLKWVQERNIFVIDETIASYVATPSDPLKGHTTKAWRLSDETKEALFQFRQDFSVSAKNKIIPNQNETAILDLRKDGVRRKSEVQLSKWVAVDTEKMIETFRRCLLSKKIAGKRYDTKQIKRLGLEEEDLERLWNLYAIAELYSGCLSQEYEEKEFGRLYGNSFHSLQLVPNRMLPYIIPNTWDYDFEACHPTLLSELSKKVNQNHKTPELDKYLENRKQARIQISKEIKSNEERVKQAINSIAYGAPMKLREWFDAETNKNRKTAILSHLGKTSGELFIKNKNVVSLHKEMEECKKIILNHSPYTDNAPKKLKRNQIIAYVLQQNERELLEIMIEEIQKQQINILALKHDGIIIKSEMDARKVEKKILEKTGIKITLDRKEIV